VQTVCVSRCFCCRNGVYVSSKLHTHLSLDVDLCRQIIVADPHKPQTTFFFCFFARAWKRKYFLVHFHILNIHGAFPFIFYWNHESIDSRALIQMFSVDCDSRWKLTNELLSHGENSASPQNFNKWKLSRLEISRALWLSFAHELNSILFMRYAFRVLEINLLILMPHTFMLASCFFWRKGNV
jgi:hypothetical protein